MATLFAVSLPTLIAQENILISKIVFLSNRTGNRDIHIMDVDGKNVINFTNSDADEGWLRCSPDGKQIAFASNRDGNMDIHLMNSAGSYVKNLTQSSGR